MNQLANNFNYVYEANRYDIHLYATSNTYPTIEYLWVYHEMFIRTISKVNKKTRTVTVSNK